MRSKVRGFYGSSQKIPNGFTCLLNEMVPLYSELDPITTTAGRCSPSVACNGWQVSTSPCSEKCWEGTSRIHFLFFFAVQFSYLTKFRCTCCFCYAPCACREGLEGVKVVVKTLGSGLRIPKNKDPSLDVSLYDYEYIDCRCEDGCFPVFANRVTIPNPESLSSSETGFICNKTLKIAFIRRSSLSESSWWHIFHNSQGS